MDLKKLIKEYLLIESAADNTVRRAMEQRKAIFFNYENKGRTVDVYAIGTTKAGNPAIVGWLRSPSGSNSLSNPDADPKRRSRDAVRWRMFRLDRVKNLMITKLPYLEIRQRTNKEKQDYRDLISTKNIFNKTHSGLLSNATTLDLNV